MYEKILVPLDGSELAEQAMPYVERLAKRLKSEVILITVCLPNDPLERALTEYIERRAEKIQSLGVKTRSLCIKGEPATSIINFAEKKLEKILVTLDGSHFSEVIIPYAEKLAKGMDSEVTLLRVIEPAKLPQLAAYRDRETYEKEFMTKLEREAKRYLAKKKTALAGKGVKVNSVLLEGKPHETILQYTEKKQVNLIALTTHGFSGIGRASCRERV